MERGFLCIDLLQTEMELVDPRREMCVGMEVMGVEGRCGGWMGHQIGMGGLCGLVEVVDGGRVDMGWCVERVERVKGVGGNGGRMSAGVWLWL